MRRCILFLCCAWLVSCQNDDSAPGGFSVTTVFAGTQRIQSDEVTENVALDQSISVNFTKAVDRSTVRAISLEQNGSPVTISFSFSAQDKTVVIFPITVLSGNTEYVIKISEALKSVDGAQMEATQFRFKTLTPSLTLSLLKIENVDVTSSTAFIDDVPLEPEIKALLSSDIDASSATPSTIALKQDGVPVETSIETSGNELTVRPSSPLKHLSRFQLEISDELKGVNGEPFSGVRRTFYTTVSETPARPLLPNDEDNDADNTNDLLSVVQQQTFRYFWDFGHPVSGMSRERNTSGDIVTSGGSGFGIMALVVGMERNFITRADGIARMDKIVAFLEGADRFHGAWSHWINGATGEAVSFSAKDDGGDLVETSFLVQGLITFRQYLSASVPAEAALRDRITALYEGVEWDWYRKQDEQVLYWHWSPNFNWDMNFPLYGYFEEQITYVLAASSPTHGIPLSVYSNGYGMNGDIVTNQTYHGVQLPLGAPAPLFWVHYSYLGMNPRFSDNYANYWTQNVAATRINYAYCVSNPRNYVGYSDQCWGLTSSDEPGGYDAHSPANDKGVITPTAALSSFPYTPEESMRALKFFYYQMGDQLWGDYGFYDAFNLTEQWTATSYLAIDQGPIIVMIENYRTGRLWELFMSAPEVQNGVNALNFTY